MMVRLLDCLSPQAWRRLAWLGVALVLALSLLRVPVPASMEFWSADKLVHVGMYASLMLSFGRGYRRARWLSIALALGALGLGIEGLQSLTPNRSASLLDEIANLSGISIMLALLRWTALGGAPESP
jgi:VanZ family protein